MTVFKYIFVSEQKWGRKISLFYCLIARNIVERMGGWPLCGITNPFISNEKVY